jgi:hypothetical protein
MVLVDFSSSASESVCRAEKLLTMGDRSGELIGVVIGVPTGDSFFFAFAIGSRCLLLRRRGRGLGDA